LGVCSPAKEALREGSDEADLNEQSNNCLNCCNDGHRIAQALHRLEEAPTVETADAEYQGFIPLQRLDRGAGQAEGEDAVGSEAVGKRKAAASAEERIRAIYRPDMSIADIAAAANVSRSTAHKYRAILLGELERSQQSQAAQ
jgi:hypothetical protein